MSRVVGLRRTGSWIGRWHWHVDEYRQQGVSDVI